MKNRNILQWPLMDCNCQVSQVKQCMENTTLKSANIITSVLKRQSFLSPPNKTNHWGTLLNVASDEFLTRKLPMSVKDHPQCFPVIQNAWPFIYPQWSVSRLCLLMKSTTAVWSSVLFLSKARYTHFHKSDWTDSFHLLTASILFFQDFLYPVPLVLYFPACFSSSAELRGKVLLSNQNRSLREVVHTCHKKMQEEEFL